MDALLLSLVLVFILDQGSTTLPIITRSAGKRASPPMLYMTAGVTVAIAAASAAIGGAISPLLVPEARLCFLGTSLLIGGGTMATSAIRQHGGAGHNDGRPLVAMGMFLLRRASENSAFAILGVTTFTAMPLWAGIGGALGGLAAIGFASMAGPPLLTRSASAALRLGAGTMIVCAGIGCVAAALRVL